VLHPSPQRRPPRLSCLAGLLSLFAVSCLGCVARSDTLAEGWEPKQASAGHDPLVGEVPSPLPAFDDARGAARGPKHSLMSLSRTELWAAWNSLRGDAYQLDAVERFLEEGTRLVCNPGALVRHAGTHLRYQGSVQIDPAFRDRLVRFEELVVEVASEVYGRAPARLSHFGAYSCRSSRNRSHRLSEHALGNAIDVTGFDFARATREQALKGGLPAKLRGPFQIRVARHWNADPTSSTSVIHSRFLRGLAERLSEREDVFRVMIGPSRSDHSDHFHFDMSPWRYVRF
jgi:hypothetical protein